VDNQIAFFNIVLYMRTDQRLLGASEKQIFIPEFENLIHHILALCDLPTALWNGRNGQTELSLTMWAAS
jgi:hypothetical protein